MHGGILKGLSLSLVVVLSCVQGSICMGEYWSKGLSII